MLDNTFRYQNHKNLSGDFFFYHQLQEYNYVYIQNSCEIYKRKPNQNINKKQKSAKAHYGNKSEIIFGIRYNFYKLIILEL